MTVTVTGGKKRRYVSLLFISDDHDDIYSLFCYYSILLHLWSLSLSSLSLLWCVLFVSGGGDDDDVFFSGGEVEFDLITVYVMVTS